MLPFNTAQLSLPMAVLKALSPVFPLPVLPSTSALLPSPGHIRLLPDQAHQAVHPASNATALGPGLSPHSLAAGSPQALLCYLHSSPALHCLLLLDVQNALRSLYTAHIARLCDLGLRLHTRAIKGLAGIGVGLGLELHCWIR